jgi:hypothetical protein
MSPDVPVPVPTPAGVFANHTCRWNLQLNFGFLIAALVILYLIHTWKQERGCACKLKALEEENQRRAG